MSEDYDDELPSVPSNITYNTSSNFSMPPAHVLASQRAREKECEQELRLLQSQQQNMETVEMDLDCQDSSSSDGEATLAAAVQVLHVETPGQSQPLDAQHLVARLIEGGTQRKYDVTFLSSYLHLLNSNNKDVITTVTHELMSDIEHCILKASQSNNMWDDADKVLLCCWLSAAMLWHAPRVRSAKRLLHALIAELQMEMADAVGDMLCESLESVWVLMSASDALKGPAPQQYRLSERLLNAAVDALTPRSPSGGCERLRASWRSLAPLERVAALQLAGRLQEREGRSALKDLLALATQEPALGDRHSPDYLRVLVGANTLQVLFDVNYS